MIFLGFKGKSGVVVALLCLLLLGSAGCLSRRAAVEEETDTSEQTLPAPAIIDVDSIPKDDTSAVIRDHGVSDKPPYTGGLIHAVNDSTAADTTIRTVPAEPAPGVVDTALSLSDSLESIAFKPVPGDTLADSTVADSLAEVEEEEEEAEADTTIDYRAEDIRFDVQRRITVLTGNSQIRYKDIILEAHSIVVDWDNDLLTATLTHDTLWTDSSRSSIDTVKVIGKPTFTEKAQTMTGNLIKVNMKTRKGYVVGGRTKYDEGFYHGHEIQKVSDEVLYVKDGAFTTCEHDHPHYSFTGNQMKMIHKKKVVGKPVVLRFGDVPVFALPFAVFSIKPGRQSGLLVPTYGDDSNRGRHFRNLGYYFALSDYWDAKVMVDFFEKRGMFYRGDVKYNKRYQMNGGISGSFDNQAAAGGGRKTNWDLKMIHNHDITPTLKLRANGTFVSSGDYYRNYSDNASRRIDQKINSNATLNKSWRGSGANLSLNMSHQQNLSTEENSQDLPNATFSLGTRQLFPTEAERKSKRRNVIYSPPEPRVEGEIEEDEDENDPWYSTITYSYRSSLKNKRDETRVDMTSGDPTSGYLEETFASGIQHTASLNAPQKVAKYFTVNPRFSYREDWFNERRFYSYNSEGVISDSQERGFFQRRTFNLGVNTGTKLYGYININRYNVKVIRHVITPSVGFNYRPDFSVVGDFPYYQALYDSTGNRIRKDRYKGSVFGGTPIGKQMSVSMSLSNLFQMKRVKLNDKGEEEEIKTDLFTYNLSTSYDFARDSLRLGALSSSLRASPITSKSSLGPLEQMSMDLSMSHSFYRIRDYLDLNGVKRRGVMDQFYWEESGHGLNFLRLTNISANSSFSFSGPSPFVPRVKADRMVKPEIQDDMEGVMDEGPPPVGHELDDRFSDPHFTRGAGSGTKPWRINGSLRYSLSMSDPQNPNETLRLTGTASVNLTRSWKFTYSSGVDLFTRDLTGASLSVSRDLHCWQGSLSWSPIGFNQGFYLLIGIKAAQLRDLKLEQRRGGGGTLPRY